MLLVTVEVRCISRSVIIAAYTEDTTSCSVEVNCHKTEVVTVLQFGGIMGPPGPPGVCSCNLTTFLNSLSLQDAIPGPPGVPGVDGKAGPPGTSVS